MCSASVGVNGVPLAKNRWSRLRFSRARSLNSRPLPVLDAERGPVVALEVGEEVLAALDRKPDTMNSATCGRSACAHANKPCKASGGTALVQCLQSGKPRLHIACAVDLDVIDVRRDIASSVGRARRLRRALAPIDVVHAGQPSQQLKQNSSNSVGVKSLKSRASISASLRSSHDPPDLQRTRRSGSTEVVEARASIGTEATPAASSAGPFRTDRSSPHGGQDVSVSTWRRST